MGDRSVEVVRADGSVIFAGDHNVVVTGEGAVALALALDRRHRRRAPAPGPRSHLDVLAPESDALPFLGREAALADLRTWLASDAPVSVRALVGAAGIGKTRLAIALCRSVDPQDGTGAGVWDAGFLPAERLVLLVDALETRRLVVARPTLVVIDEAAAGAPALARWLDRLAAEPAAARLRLLLIERAAAPDRGWWRALTRPVEDGAERRVALFAETTPRPLPGLGDLETRRALLRAACAAALGAQEAAPIPEPGSDPAFDARLAEARFATPLALVTAGALAAGQPGKPALALRPLDAARRLARRELERLRRRAGSAAEAITHAVAFNELAGGLPTAGLRRSLADALAAAGHGADADVPARLLREEHPPRGEDPGEPERLGVIEPALLGGAVILEALAEEHESDRVDLVARAYAATGHRAAAALMRLARDWAPLADDAEAGAPEAETARRVIGWVAALAERIEDPLALEPLGFALPEETVALQEAALAITFRLAAASLAALTDEPGSRLRAAIWQGNLAGRFANVGEREGALHAAEASVRLWATLARERPAAFAADCAGALGNLAHHLHRAGRLEEALGAALAGEEALASATAEEHADAIRAGLLVNGAMSLGGLGRSAEAAARTRAAIALLRPLAAGAPDAHEPDLARALANLAAFSADCGDLEEALAAAEGAVALNRRLAAEAPDAFGPSLASALACLGGSLGDLGRDREALPFVAESARLLVGLAERRPRAFGYDAARALSTLGRAHAALGDAAAAEAAYADALDRLAAWDTDGSTAPERAVLLEGIAVALHRAGRPDRALPAIEEAVALMRGVLASRPLAQAQDYPRILTGAAAIRRAAGLRADARAAIEEAVAGHRALAAENPGGFAPGLSRALGLLSDLRADDGDGAGALAALDEGIRVLAPLFLARPAPHAGTMAAHLRRYEPLSSALGHTPDAALLGPVLAAFATLEQDASP